MIEKPEAGHIIRNESYVVCGKGNNGRSMGGNSTLALSFRASEICDKNHFWVEIDL